MEKVKNIIFDVYRFQIVPITTQMGLFDKLFNNIEELKRQKNFYFSEVLNKSQSKHYHNRQMESLPYKGIYIKDDLIVFRLAAKKGRIIQDSNFTQKEVEDYPDVLIIINNDPTIQKIAISRNAQAFSNSEVVVHILESQYRVLGIMKVFVILKSLFSYSLVIVSLP